MPPEVTEGEELADDAGDALDQMNTLLDKGGEDPDKGEVEDLEDEAGGEGDEGTEGDEDTPHRVERKEGEEEEEEEDDEELIDADEDEELKTAGQPQLLKDLDKKYPKLLKEFKPLRNVILREHAFSQLYGHPREAAEASQLLEDYREFENEVLAGNNGKVLAAIKATNADGYKKFVRNFLPALREDDQKSYAEVTFPVLADVLSRARDIAASRGDKNLLNSVKHLAGLIWPKNKGEVPEISEPEKDDPKLEERRKALEEREHKLDQKLTSEFITSVRGLSSKLLRKKAEKGLDPNSVLTPFLKNSVVDKTMTDVQELMDDDVRFNQVMQRIFDRARRSGFSSEYKTRMIGTYIGRAAQLIGPIRKRHLNAALGKVEKGGKNTPPMRREVGESAAAGHRGGDAALRGSEVDFSRSSDLDILSGRAKLKKR